MADRCAHRCGTITAARAAAGGTWTIASVAAALCGAARARPFAGGEPPLGWLAWIAEDDAALVRARAEGVRWKLICWRFGISRPTAWRRWRHALGMIVRHLNEASTANNEQSASISVNATGSGLNPRR